MENWKKLKEFITPGNLIKLGNVRYSTLAACLDLLEYYVNNLANLSDDDIKLNGLLNKWQSAQASQDNLAALFISTLESKQQLRGETELNALISELQRLDDFVPEMKGYIRIGKLSYNPNELLGEGSMGTSVFMGYFEKRPIAVKRYLTNKWSETAQNEADCLIKADLHPNIIRYYCTEKYREFIFLGLQRCQTNLQALMDGNGPKLPTDPVALSGDILEGLSHLHNLKPRAIVHRNQEFLQ